MYNLLITGGDIESNPGPRPTENTLSIVHININSLRNKVLLIEAELSMFDIIVVTETKLDESVPNDTLVITGYHYPLLD